MIPTDTTTGHPYTPSWCADVATPPRYFFRGGSIVERTRLEAELSGQFAASRVYASELYDAAREGVTALLGSAEEVEKIVALIDRQQEGELAAAVAASKGEVVAPTLSVMERQDLIEIYGILARSWAAYRELVAQQARRRELAPLLAFSRFCTGWENVVDAANRPIPFELGSDRLIPDAILRRIDPMELKAAGSYAFQLLYGEPDDRNFTPPSLSDDAPETSLIDTSRADGKSKAKGGKKTPA